MKNVLEKLLIRSGFYGFLFCWFYFIVPVLWSHGSSWALECMFGFSVFFLILAFYLEILISQLTEK